ncbi:MAG: metal dependent phosphohydrolase [Candidatus Brocadiaceae bacterium]|nr:metal dependent phosphohydrolase [Candidatus Brocadiaceae bacterium]
MGLDEKELKDLEIAALLHDVGKIGTFESIIDKKEKLTDEEYAVIKQHTIKESRGTIPGTGTDCGFCPPLLAGETGVRAFKKAQFMTVRSISPIKHLKSIIPGVKYHHEFYNGKGYPEGIKGEEMLPMASILRLPIVSMQ